MAQSEPLSAWVEPTSPVHHVGKIVFVELSTPDITVAKRFYADLLGWDFRDLSSGDEIYAQAFVDGQLVAGLSHRTQAADQRSASAWLGFISVRDIAATKSLALSLGGTLLIEPRSLPSRGEDAVFEDPQGAVFAVLASSSGDSADEWRGPGEWIWSSLSTPDPESDAGFYQQLFSYDVHDLDDDLADSDVTQHLMFATEDFARASANSLPANQPNASPHWLHHVHVEDVTGTSARLISLGGRVLVEPHVDRQGGRVAIVCDPLGAVFGLLEWPNASDIPHTPEIPEIPEIPARQAST